MVSVSTLFPTVSLIALLATAIASAEETKPVVKTSPVYTQFDQAPHTACEGLPDCDFILLDGDPEAGPTQWFFRLRAGTAFPRHWHSTPENMVTIHGALTFVFETGETITLKPGEHLRYPAGMIHGGQCEPGTDCLFYVYNDAPYDFHLAN